MKVLQKFGYGEKFICLIKVAYTNIQSKIEINGLLSDPFTLMQGVRHGCPLLLVLYIMVAEVLANFTDANKRMKAVQIGDHGIKLVNFADDITIFLEDITCLNRIQVILKLHEEDSKSEINFSKSQALYRLWHIKIKTDKPGQMARSKFPIKLLILILWIILSITSIGIK